MKWTSPRYARLSPDLEKSLLSPRFVSGVPWPLWPFRFVKFFRQAAAKFSWALNKKWAVVPFQAMRALDHWIE